MTANDHATRSGNEMNDDDEDDFELARRPISEARKLGRQIRTFNWQGRTSETLEVASECSSAKWRFTSDGLIALRRTARMSETTFRRLAAIGSDWRLSRMQPLLPATISTLYEITKLNNQTFDDAIKAGIIHPEMRLAEVKALQRPANPNDKSIKREREDPLELAHFSDIATGVHHHLIVSEDANPYRLQLEEVLAWLHTKLHVRTTCYEFVIPEETNRYLCAQIEQVLCWLQNRFDVQIYLNKNSKLPQRS
jgi:hypothetical protein